MPIRFDALAVVSAAALLSACDEVSYVTDPSGPNALNIGTTSIAQSPSGLPFATGQSLGDLNERYALIGRLVRFETDWTSERSTIVVDEEVIEISFVADEDFLSAITLNGQTYELIESDGRYEAELPNGQILTVESAGNTAVVGILNVYSYSDFLDTGFDTDGFIVLGLQTNPGELPQTPGTVIYRGSVFGFGNRFDQDGAYLSDGERFDGTAEIDVRFADGEVSGTYLELGLTSVEGSPAAFFSGNGAPIVGNGFADTMSIIQGACPEMTTCSGTVLIGGAFFGADAEELAGNVGVDYTIISTETDLGERFVGAGAFVADPVLPP